MIKVLFILLSYCYLLQGEIINYNIKPQWLQSNKFMNIKILDSKELKFDKIDSIKVSELSALAYNKNKLYALGDKGFLFHFNISIKNNKIKELKLKKAYQLKDKKGKNLKCSMRDSEGMVFVDGNLLISFEKKPRVELFSLQAKKIKNKKIDKVLQKISNYQNENKALEAVAYSKKYGVVTAPELALKKEDKDFHMLYAKNKTWKFPACGSLTALEFIDENSILVLERKLNKKSNKRVITLSQIYLKKCKNEICKSRIIVKLKSKKGWNIDNFEGLTKVSKNRYLIISDDNEKENQKTLLVLFEILKK